VLEHTSTLLSHSVTYSPFLSALVGSLYSLPSVRSSCLIN